MNGIELKSGVNNCHWNTKGKCTNQKITRNKIMRGYTRDWNSKQNCTLTILGVHVCSGYKPDTLEIA